MPYTRSGTEDTRFAGEESQVHVTGILNTTVLNGKSHGRRDILALRNMLPRVWLTLDMDV